jgi:sensor domain CHASE-containing protein
MAVTAVNTVIAVDTVIAVIAVTVVVIAVIVAGNTEIVDSAQKLRSKHPLPV